MTVTAATEIAATPPLNVHTDSVFVVTGPYFYRIGVMWTSGCPVLPSP